MNTPNISAEEVMEMINSKNKCILVDVRTEAEFLRGTIPGSIHLPIELSAEKVKSIIHDKHQSIVLFCLSGSRSDIVAHQLRYLGYTNAYSLTHGLLEWRMKKYPMTTD